MPGRDILIVCNENQGNDFRAFSSSSVGMISTNENE